MPATIKANASSTVIPTYTIQRNLAVSRTRGVILSATGPGTSALNNWTPPTPSNGRIAI